ncbi:MAG: PEP-CTERM sorting domain-containing protein, partial [Candidatus Omnitrophica bacterium]|nr:PEP-CTERM sorting domain-containing protein [Candidatus Omnitrophota bacterium]
GFGMNQAFTFNISRNFDLNQAFTLRDINGGDLNQAFTVTTAAPEPSSLALFGLGLLGLVKKLRKRR